MYLNPIESNLYFSTYTSLNWLPILEDDASKEIVIKSLSFLVDDKRIKLYAFVIMPNHIHLIWEILEGHLLKNVQRDFLKYTAQQIKFNLIATNNPILDELLVYSRDRMTQVWERNGLSFMLNDPDTIVQKMNYIHNNPIKGKWSLCEAPEGYKYSSASFYSSGADDFNMLTNIAEVLR